MNTNSQQQNAASMGTVVVKGGETYTGRFYGFRVIAASVISTLERTKANVATSALVATTAGGQGIGSDSCTAGEVHTSGPHPYTKITLAAGSGRFILMLDENQ
jgi:hypothetical protein